MDLSSRKLPMILIAILLGVLAFQYYNATQTPGEFIDSETCEIFITDPKINAKQYTGEFDTKCLEFKNLNK